MSSSGSWPLTTSIQEIATDLYESSREFITEDIGKLKLLNWHKNRIIVFDPENGNIEFEVYLLSPSSALDRIPKFSFKKYVNRFKKVWERYVTQLRDLSFWDIYYKYVPSCNPRDWIPPFQGEWRLIKCLLLAFCLLINTCTVRDRFEWNLQLVWEK